MGHVSTEEMWDTKGSGDSKAVREWERKFIVCFDEIVHPPEAMEAPGVPLKWEGHPLDAAMLAEHADAVHIDGSPYVWLVTISYSSKAGDEERGQDDPRARPTEIETDFASFQVPMLYDKNGKAVLNSAKDRFDPSWQMEDSRPIIRFARYESSLDLARSLAFRNAVNTDSFLGIFEAGELMCMHIKQKRHFENGIECYYTQYEFQGKANGTITSNGSTLDYDGWDAVIPDMGFNEILNGKKVAIHTKPDNGKPGKPVSKEVRLDGNGKALSETATLEQTCFRVFQPPYRYQAFSLLGLP